MTRKHRVFLFSLVAVIFSVWIFGIAWTHAPRRGKTPYYTKVTTSAPADNGAESWQYEYSLPAYTAQGEPLQLAFRAPRILRRDAYLRVYVSVKGAVTAWEEVIRNDVPEKASRQLH